MRGALNAFFTAHPRLADRVITSVLAKSIDTPPTGTGTSSDSLRDDIDAKVSAYLIHRLPWMAREIWTHTGEELRATYEMMGLKVEEVVKEKVAEAARVAPVGDDERKVHVPVAVNVSAGNSKAQKKRKQVVATAEVEDGGNDDDDDFFVGN